MELWRFLGAAVVAAVVFSVVRVWNPQFEMPMKLAGAVFFLGLLLSHARDVLNALRGMLADSALGGYAAVLLSALGIAILSQSVADICRECRESSIAGYVELAARLEILGLCLPLVEDVLAAVEGLL